MEELLFGYTWEEIQSMQQGTYQRNLISGPSVKPIATEADIQLLKGRGLAYLQDNGLYGVIDRLQNLLTFKRENTMNKCKCCDRYYEDCRNAVSGDALAILLYCQHEHLSFEHCLGCNFASYNRDCKNNLISG